MEPPDTPEPIDGWEFAFERKAGHWVASTFWLRAWIHNGNLIVRNHGTDGGDTWVPLAVIDKLRELG